MKSFCFLALFCSYSIALMAVPFQVIMIRHAEKPESGHDLSKRGYERAHALVPYFTAAPAVEGVILPSAIYAQAVSKNHQSLRPIQTIMPLADVLKIQPDASFTEGDVKHLVNEI